MRRLQTLLLSGVAGGLLLLGGARVAPAQDPLVVNAKTIRLELENDRVRVLEARLQPGDQEQMHSHPAYVVYVVAGGKVRTHGADGKATEAELKTGEVIYREPVTHWAENIGTTDIHLILVGAARPRPGPGPEPSGDRRGGTRRRQVFARRGIVAAARDERRRGEIARDVEHRGEEVGNRVDRDQDADALDWQPDGEEERREHDERAARDARRGEREEHRGEGDRGQLRRVQRDAVEPADEQRADGPRHRRGDLERRDSERQHESGHPLAARRGLLGALDQRRQRGDATSWS